MAHGVIPPFANYLVSRDFFQKVSMDRTPTEDIRLLGTAANEVIVTCEVAQMLQSITRRAYHDYLAYGFFDLRDPDGAFSLPERRFISLLTGVTLDLDDAVNVVERLLPLMRRSSVTEWKILINGVMDPKIRMVEDELGQMIKDEPKDMFAHVPEETGYIRLERLLGSN